MKRINSDQTIPAGTVTAMFTDIVDSTRLKPLMAGNSAAGRDKAFRRLIKQPHDQLLAELVGEHDGHKIKSTGDGFLFVFRDVAESILCALRIQESLRMRQIETPLGPLQLRIGIHTGHADIAGDEDYTATMMDKAARVLAEAPRGGVCLSEESRVLVGDLRKVVFEPLPETDLRGLGPTHLYRVSRDSSAQPGELEESEASPDELENPYEFATTASQTTFKGRRAEMEELLDSIETRTHSAIFGLQRMGKTSLIEQGLKAELALRPALRDRILLACIDMQRLGGAQVTYRDFAHAIFEAVVAQLNNLHLAREVNNLRALTADLFAANLYQRGDRTEFFSVFGRLLAQLTKVSKRRIVLFIDEFSEIRKVIERNKIALQKNPARTAKLLPHDMFIDVPFIHHLGSLLKDDSLRQQITFIVVVRPFIAEYDEREGLQLLKLMKPITLSRLDEVAANDLITKPLEGRVSYEAGAVDHLIGLTAGHPYLLQFMLKLVVDRIKRSGKRVITLKEVQRVQERMITDGPAFDAQFAVLISDYSVDEIMHPKEALLGKGMLALISKLGQHRDGWVNNSEIFQGFARYKIPEEKTSSLLSQLTRTHILEEREKDDALQYRLSVPLVQERFVRQNLYLKYFRNA